ncbi:hypothetical protein Tsubulata_050411 [Turnera subulata]|uniref:Uncharacterized protein n=1 Tax=Turnera subulata TaxID=218843 RepID=A0A9Q0GIJ6_9ROSI|nr:hypothetical protein Tsubulata_050411 [Turnera subulata]
MAEGEDVEYGSKGVHREVREPLMKKDQTQDGSVSHQNGSKESVWMVYLSTFVAVCGSFAFGSCAGYSSPTQNAIIEDVSLSLAEVICCVVNFSFE